MKSKAEEIDEMTLKDRMIYLAEMKTELRAKRNEFKYNTRHLRESIKSLEAIITDEVMKSKQTIEVGNIRAEYIPQVRFQMRRQNDGE